MLPITQAQQEDSWCKGDSNMFQKGFVKFASIELVRPIAFAPEKDGSLEFCVDYRSLGPMTMRVPYLQQLMDECIAFLGEARISWTLDANAGYYQIKIDGRDRSETAVPSDQRIVKFKQLQFNLKKAPVTLQRATDPIIYSVKWQSGMVYIKDIMVFSRNSNNHLAHFRQLLALLWYVRNIHKLKRYSFFAVKVNHLVHLIQSWWLKLVGATTATVRQSKHARLRRNWDHAPTFVTCCTGFSKTFSKGVHSWINHYGKISQHHASSLPKQKRTQ